MMTHEDGALHLRGDAVQTIVLALCCLEFFWEDHPEVVTALAKQKGEPDLVRFAKDAKPLRLALQENEKRSKPPKTP